VAVKYDLDAYLKSYIAATIKAICEYSQNQIDESIYDVPCHSYEEHIKKCLFLKFCLENMDCYSDEEQDTIISLANRYARNCGKCTVSDAELAAFKETEKGKELSEDFLDPDVKNYKNKSGVSDGVIIPLVNTYVTELKAAGIWNKFYAIYPFLGGSSSTTSYNLKDADYYQITWAGTMAYGTLGVDFDGVSGFGDTNFDFSAISSTIEDIHFSFYTPDANGGLANVPMGVGSTAADDRIRMAFDAGTDNYYADMWSNGAIAGRVSVSGLGAPAGHYLASRFSASTAFVYLDGVQKALNSTTVDVSDVPSDTFYVGAANVAGVASGFTTKTLGLATIGKHLTASDITSFHTITDKFLTSLGR
jgi:hypothetical protein